MTRRARWVALAVSLVAHAAVILLVQSSSARRIQKQRKAAVEIELELAPEGESSVLAVNALRALGSASRVHDLVTPPSRIAAIAPRSSVVDAPVGTAATLVDPLDEPATPPASCDVPAFDPSVLDPANVARLSGIGGDGDLADAGTVFQEEFRENANGRAYVSTRPPPDLHAERDGRYTFRNNRFHATVLPNGDVEFRDIRVGASGPDVRYEEDPEFGGQIVVSLFTLRFDITEEWMRANGQDPLRTERAWFMRETEALRDRLHADAERGYNRDSMRELMQRLDAIASDTRLSLRRKHELVFETWDDCAIDAVGAGARGRIVAFVRERFAAGTVSAFTVDELVALNARRTSQEEFDPYAADRDAGPA